MGRGHVDAVRRIDQIDGYEIALTQVDGSGGDRTALEDYN